MRSVPKHIDRFIRALTGLDPIYQVKCLVSPFNVLKIRSLDRYYHERDDLLLHASFQILVDFVEEELAYFTVWCGPVRPEEQLTRWEKFRYMLFGTFRSARLGIEHLNWSIAHADECIKEYPDEIKHFTEEKEAHAAILFLYRWWKEVRPERVDAWELSGLREFFDKHHDQIVRRFHADKNPEVDPLTDEEHKEYSALVIRDMEIEQSYLDEDMAMLQLLAKYRIHLST